jgi:hypothetical protein
MIHSPYDFNNIDTFCLPPPFSPPFIRYKTHTLFRDYGPCQVTVLTGGRGWTVITLGRVQLIFVDW